MTYPVPRQESFSVMPSAQARFKGDLRQACTNHLVSGTPQASNLRQLAPMPSAPGSIAPCWCSRLALLTAEERHEAARELWRASLAKIRDQFARRLGWIPLSARSEADGLNDLTLLLSEYRDEVVVGGHDGDASFSQPIQREVAMIASDEHIDLTRQARGGVHSVIRVTRQRFIDERKVLGRFEPLVGEERANNLNDRCRGVRRTTLLAHDDAFPFVDQFIGPDPRENTLLGQREQRVHDREREEFVGVHKDTFQACHPASVVGETGVSHRSQQRLMAFAKSPTFVARCEDVGHPKAAVAAAGKTTERQHLVLAQAIDVLPSDSKYPRRLRRSDLVFGAQHHDKFACRDVIEHRPNKPTDRRRIIDAFGKSGSVAAYISIRRIKSVCGHRRRHDLMVDQKVQQVQRIWLRSAKFAHRQGRSPVDRRTGTLAQVGASLG